MLEKPSLLHFLYDFMIKDFNFFVNDLRGFWLYFVYKIKYLWKLLEEDKKYSCVHTNTTKGGISG